MQQFIDSMQWVFLFYFIGVNLGYMSLNILASFSLFRHMEEHVVDKLLGSTVNIAPPISIIVPAYNEAVTIVGSIKALLQLEYAEYEVVIVNDGSKDNTISELINAFDFTPYPEAYRDRIKSKPIHGFYRSSIYSNLRLIDKDNGGKADSLNAGINSARFPLFCAVDADSILHRDSLQRVVIPFLRDSRTVASGGTVRIANGCTIEKGFLSRAGLPTNILALFQIIEYLRAFLFGRLGWSPLNALLIISGAFGLFHKETVISVGGYNTDTVGEDMELVVRMHRELRARKKDYRITFLPDPICWTDAPEDIATLSKQRTRWQRGLAESMTRNISLLFNPRAGFIGFASYPFVFFFELIGPLVEVFGLVIIIFGFFTSMIPLDTFILLLLVAVGFGILTSLTSLLLEEMSFHIYQKPSELLKLLAAAILENFGYRQLSLFWRVQGMWQWLAGKKHGWGEMTRSSKWK